MEREVRFVKADVELRAADNGDKIAGYAAVFNSEAEIYGFREVILPGAFSRAIKEDDVRALFNHDPSLVLGRNTAGTLRLVEDDKGLRMEADPPDTQTGRDVVTLIKRGDVTGQSFSFRVTDEVWSKRDGVDYREIRGVQLFDVGPVTFPAYDDTTVALRSYEAWKQTQKQEPSSEPHSDLSLYQRRQRAIVARGL